MNRELAGDLFDSGIRIDAMWPIHGLTDALPSEFESAVEDRGLPTLIAKMIPEFHEDGDLNGDDFSEAMGDAFNRGMFGYIIKASHMSYTANSDISCSCSWGRSRVKLFYAETVEEGIRAAMAWDREDFDAEIAAFKARQPA